MAAACGEEKPPGYAEFNKDEELAAAAAASEAAALAAEVCVLKCCSSSSEVENLLPQKESCGMTQLQMNGSLELAALLAAEAEGLREE